MAEDKEHPASAKKLRKAREKGQDPQSSEIYDFCDVVVGYAAMTMLLPTLAGLIISLMRFDHLVWQTWSLGGTDRLGLSLLLSTMQSLAPTLAGSCFIAGLLGYIGNRGRPPSAVPLKISYNPMSKITGMFQPSQVLGNLRGWVGAVLVMAFAVWVSWHELPALVSGTFCSDGCDVAIAKSAFELMVVPALFVKFLFSVFDVVLKRMKFMKDQKMSHEEVKREHKEDQGDPHIKGKRKQLAREAAQGR